MWNAINLDNSGNKLIWAVAPLAVLALGLIVAFFPTAGVKYNDILIIYLLAVAFSLPALIAKAIFKRAFFSYFTVLLYLIYPLLYLLAVTFARLQILSIESSYLIFGALTCLLWQFAWTTIVNRMSSQQLSALFEKFVYVGIVVVGYVVLTLLVRDYGSIISTDVLVHKTVLNGMLDPNKLGLMPATYSNMFTDQGYPILMYHTFLFFTENAFGFDFVKLAYYLDLMFSVFSIFVVFRLFAAMLDRKTLATFATAITMLIFENLAYSYHFLIPQTLTFLFLTMIIIQPKLKAWELSLSIALLCLSHFFIGPYLALLLVLNKIYIPWLLKSASDMRYRLLYLLPLSALGIVFLLASTGVSFEQVFQAETLKWVGQASNPDFSGQLTAIRDLLGFGGWLILLLAIVNILTKKENSQYTIWAFYGVIISLCAYLLAPTFAAKFFIGFGLFATFLIAELLDIPKLWIGHNKLIGRYVATVFAVIFAVNFMLQFQAQLPFLQQKQGPASAVVQKDADLISFWREESPNCLVISDPQTQLAIHSLGKGNSARGPYMTLESRGKLQEFVRFPTSANLQPLFGTPELANYDGEVCFIMTARLAELAYDNTVWVDLIFHYIVDQPGVLTNDDNVVEFLNGRFNSLYKDEYSQVYVVK